MSRETVVIDSSVCVAIFKGESDTDDLTDRTYSYQRRVMSAATWLESAMVCEGSTKKAERNVLIASSLHSPSR